MHWNTLVSWGNCEALWKVSQMQEGQVKGMLLCQSCISAHYSLSLPYLPLRAVPVPSSTPKPQTAWRPSMPPSAASAPPVWPWPAMLPCPSAATRG